MPQTKDLLHKIIHTCQKLGADQADCLYVSGSSLSAASRSGKFEKLSRAEGSDLGLRVFVNNRNALVSSNENLDQLDIEAFCARALDLAKILPEDPYSGLADKSLTHAQHKNLNLELYDQAQLLEKDMIAEAIRLENLALAHKGITNSEGASVSCGSSEFHLLTSNDFYGSYKSSHFNKTVTVIAGHDQGMERDYDYSSTRHLSDLTDSETLARNAATQAIKRLGARKIKSQQVPIFYEPRMARSFIYHLLSAISGPSIIRGASFLREDLGKQVFSADITIRDEPHLKRGTNSRPFDAEGIPTNPMSFIEKGILTNWHLDLKSAKQLGLKPTGHAGRGVSSTTSPTPSNMFIQPGKQSPEQLYKSIGTGFLVTELLGSSVNMLTGDYSRGASGFWIENGEIAYPVNEITVAGNLRDMFKSCIPANDLTHKYGVDSPTLLVHNMTIAGKSA